MHRLKVRTYFWLVTPAVLLMTSAASAQSTQDGYGPFLGTWKSMHTPKVSMTWEDRGGGIVYVSTEDAVLESGPLEVFAFRQDGRDYPYAFRAGDVTSTIASSAIDSRTIEVTYKLGGTRVTRSRWNVSEDGLTMTVGRPDGSTWNLTRHARDSAEPRDLTTGYKRYIGIWEAVQNARGATTGSVVWEDRGDDFVVATVRDRDGWVTMRYSLKYDGRPYPCVSGSGGVGTMTSVFVDEYKTMWSMFRADGTPGGSGTRIVNPDGQGMIVPGRGGEGNDLIWRRVGNAPTDGILTP